MPLEIGLKLWNTNFKLFAEAKALYSNKIINFIELYMVPTSYDASTLLPLVGLPVHIHAPHENHNFNIFTAGEKDFSEFQRVSVNAANLFDSPTIVVHAGVGTNNKTFKHQLALLNDDRVIIENMPFYSLQHDLCYGYSLDQLKYIYDHLHRHICLDLGHAIKSAVAQQLDYKVFIENIIRNISPSYYHLSDGDPTTDIDEHLNLGAGSYDLSWMKRQLLVAAEQQTVQIVFEVPKNNTDLTNDRKNIEYFHSLS
ncbi:MAG: TIM barrel protein [Patescibacteria group bacterium]